MTETKKSKIIVDPKDGEKAKLDTSVIKANEHFTYLGKVYVKKLMHGDKIDEQGNPVRNKYSLPDGSIAYGLNVPSDPWDEFFELEIVKTDSPLTIRQYGRPLTTQIIPHGPIDAADLFKYDGEPIKYQNIDFADLVLTKKGNAVVWVSGVEKPARR